MCIKNNYVTNLYAARVIIIPNLQSKTFHYECKPMDSITADEICLPELKI